MTDLTNISALSPTDIIAILELEYTDEVWEQWKQVLRKARLTSLRTALEIATSAGTRRTLCYTLGRRCNKASVPSLIKCLYDKNAKVRTEAAEALGNIGDPSAGPVLLERFIKQETHLLAYALGGVGYRPAIPALLSTLKDPSKASVHGSVALSLGVLGAIEAEDILKERLEEALSQEEAEESTISLFRRPLEAVQLVARALSSNDTQSSVAILSDALDNRDPVFNESAAWALSVIGGPEAETQLRLALTRMKQRAHRTKRIKEALISIAARY